MDIEANLARQKELIATGELEDADVTAELFELVEAMHEWFEKGGFLPAAWKGCK